jgi:type IV secretory pathway VirB10-like protein
LFELIRRGMNIAATIKTRAGYAFNVVVTQDVVFLDPYKERVRP